MKRGGGGGKKRQNKKQKKQKTKKTDRTQNRRIRAALIKVLVGEENRVVRQKEKEK